MVNLYTETAFQAKPASSAQRVDIQVPRVNGTYDRSKYSKKPERNDRLATDDKSFAAEYLASASSVFFRQSHAYPRSFLWRVIAKPKTLEIVNADFARPEKNQEADKTLAFEFQDEISPRGVTFCDAGKGDAFFLFVLTMANEVFEIRVQTDFFSKTDSIPSDLQQWCSPIRASSLSIDKAFQIHASNSEDVFVSFASGKVQHWKRQDISHPWAHVTYDDRGWGLALLSIVNRKGYPDIDFNGARLAHNTSHAMARSGQYLFTACLNHTLRIWHLESGKLVQERDLLDQARDPKDRKALNPAEPGYIQLLESAIRHEQFLLTYSSLDGGQVKLWKVTNSFDDDTSQFDIEDVAPNKTLPLPDPDPTGNTVWSLAGLKVVFDQHNGKWQAWALWRNHNYHKAYSLVFDRNNIADQWQNDWVTISATATKTYGPDLITTDTQDVTTKWLEHLFFPGRYSTAVLETALAQYATAIDTKLSSADRNKSLQERLTLLISSQVSLRSYEDSTVHYERFTAETDSIWRQFCRLLETMNEGRYAPLALAADSFTGMVIVTMADMCCLVRECSDLELLQTSKSTDMNDLQRLSASHWYYRKDVGNVQQPDKVQVVLSASQKFITAFTPDLMANFLRTLEEDIYIPSGDIPPATRIVNFFNEIDFANAVPDEVEKEFLKDLSSIGGIDAISDQWFESALKLLSEHKARRGRPHNLKTEFGVQAFLAGILSDIQAAKQLLLSLLAVAIFVDETEHFNNSALFEQLVGLLRIQERNLWLATHYRTTEEGTPISILADLYAQSVRPQSSNDHPLTYTFTQHLKDSLDFISGQSDIATEQAAVFYQCYLLRHNELQLAQDFLKFQPATAWSVYVKSRLSLLLGSYNDASLYFREAAAGMSGGKALGNLQELSSGLLSVAEAACFYAGLPKYYEHIVALFESQQANSEAAEFARLALAALQSRKGEPEPNFKQNIFHRLFRAELKCSKFDEAYQTLVQFSDVVLQRACVTDLIDTMLNASTSQSDTSGIVMTIQKLPLSTHPQLATYVDRHIEDLAKKQTSIPSAGVMWLASSTVDYLSILHALRISKKDYRGAVSVLFDRLRIVQKSGRARSDPHATSLRHALLALINALTCVDEDEAYILAEAKEDPRLGESRLKRMRDQKSNDGPARKKHRVIVTLDDLRREYQKVLDRCSRIERGDFAFGEGDEESDEDEEDGAWTGSKLYVDKNMSGALQLANGDAMEVS